jgi:ketosteroid isomerase-like protein
MESADTESIAARLRDAYQTGDLAALEELLHPQVRWGGAEDTPQTCHNRLDVLTWYEQGYRSGMRATVLDVLTRPGAVLFTLRVSGRRPGKAVEVHQVFRLADGLIADIRGYPERDLALALLDTPLPVES